MVSTGGVSDSSAATPRVWAWTLAIVVVSAVLFASRTFVSIDRQRAKLIEQPAAPTNGAVSVSDDSVRSLTAIGQPLAVIARIHNPDSAPYEYTVSIDDRPACTVTVPASSHQRVDCRISADVARGGSSVRVDGPGVGWSVEYLELATHHGNTDGLFYLVFLPGGSSLGVRPSLSSTLTLAAVLILLAFVPQATLGRRIRLLWLAVTALIALLVVIIMVTPWFTPYLIVASTGTVIRLLTVLYVPQIVTAARWLAAPSGRVSGLLKPAIIGVFVAAMFWSVMHTQLWARHGGEYSGVLLISRPFFDQNPLMAGRDDVRGSIRLINDGGYDGQFMYYLTFDPLMRRFSSNPHQYRSVVDAVPYRFGRIGYPWLADIITAGNWRAVPAAMWWLLVIATGAGAFALAAAAQDAGLSPLVGLAALVVPGYWQSIQNGLPEPIAGALLFTAGWLLRRERQWPAAICCALALLVRETAIVLVLGLAAAMFQRRGHVRTVRFLAIAVAPMIVWRLYVGLIIFPDWGPKGFYDPSPILEVPFRGFIDLWDVVRSGQYYSGSAEFARAAYAYPVLLIGGLAVALLAALRRPGPVAVAAVTYGMLAVSMNYRYIWDHIGNGQRGSYELFVTLALALLAWRSYSRGLQYALVAFWLATAWYTAFGAFDATALRAAAHLPI